MILDWIDEKLLAFFTKVSHKFQILTGKTNFFLAKIAIFIIMTGIVLNSLDYWLKFLGENKTSVFGIIIDVWLIWLMAWDIHKLDKADKALLSSSERVKPDTPLNNQFLRKLFLLFTFLEIFTAHEVLIVDRSGVMIFKVIVHFFAPEVLVASYFCAVTPLPPGKSKVREFIESFTTGQRELVPVPVARPQK